MQQALEAYLSFRKDDLPWLWVTKYGKRLAYDGIGQDMERLAEAAGIKGEIVDICHGWRRYCAVQSQEQGMDPTFILTNMGWTSYTMFNHYTRSRLEERKRAIRAFQNFAPGRNRPADDIQPRPANPVPVIPLDGPALHYYDDLELPPGASMPKVKAAFQKLPPFPSSWRRHGRGTLPKN